MHRRNKTQKKWLLHFYIFGYKTTKPTTTTSITMYDRKKKIALC